MRKAYFNSNNDSALLMLGVERELRLDGLNNLARLQQFLDETKGSFHAISLAYDLKNEIEHLHSKNTDEVKFPAILIWIPEIVLEQSEGKWITLKGRITADVEAMLHQLSNPDEFASSITLKPTITKEDYLANVKSLLSEIRLGNIYEVNFCQEFLARNVQMQNPLACYHRLNSITEAPFSAYFEVDEFVLMCGSPERFLKKTGNRLISEPIKGTIARSEDQELDQKRKLQLKEDPKERAENIMIVDLVRNDLSRIASKDSVRVEELCEIYSFKTVHQMISKISCDMKPNLSFTDVIRATFPMGSMTGAPKISAMLLIEKFESFRRGIYSGSLGYIKPNGDFDLNVVIRSLIYNKEKQIVSCAVGGALTINSLPEKEYEECMAKVGKIIEGMNG